MCQPGKRLFEFHDPTRVWRINQRRTNPFSGKQLYGHGPEDDSILDLIEYVSDRQRNPTIYFISLIFVRSSYCRLTHSLTLNWNDITGDMSFMCNDSDMTRPWTASIVDLLQIVWEKSFALLQLLLHQ
mmetsp:Transcript_9015/g.16341  ORF Transcript_9015/g.16341 Transcript_9015/m.16341 type:complete len:128 (-) Transcript_9015:794-1177(-)